MNLQILFHLLIILVPLPLTLTYDIASCVECTFGRNWVTWPPPDCEALGLTFMLEKCLCAQRFCDPNWEYPLDNYEGPAKYMAHWGDDSGYRKRDLVDVIGKVGGGEKESGDAGTIGNGMEILEGVGEMSGVAARKDRVTKIRSGDDVGEKACVKNTEGYCFDGEFPQPPPEY